MIQNRFSALYLSSLTILSQAGHSLHSLASKLYSLVSVVHDPNMVHLLLSGGLYWWSARLAGPRWGPFASWTTGADLAHRAVYRHFWNFKKSMTLPLSKGQPAWKWSLSSLGTTRLNLVAYCLRSYRVAICTMLSSSGTRGLRTTLSCSGTSRKEMFATLSTKWVATIPQRLCA